MGNFVAVHNFAKQTGELHSLSRVDLSLIALAYTLEAAARGTSHLRASPAPPRAVKASRKGRGTAVPGWGDSGGVWDELDAIEDPDEPGECIGIQFCLMASISRVQFKARADSILQVRMLPAA